MVASGIWQAELLVVSLMSFPFFGGKQSDVSFFSELLRLKTAFFNARLQMWKGTTATKRTNTPAGYGHQNTEKWLEV